MASAPQRPNRHPERGIALVTALLVLLMTAVLAGTFMATSTSERAIASNVHIARASLVSADAGVRVAQQVLANRARARLDSLCAAWTGIGPIVTNPANMFPGGVLTVSGGNPGYNAQATIAFADSDLTDSAQVYNYVYTITATGSFGNVGQRQVQSSGLLRVSAERGSFADYLFFVNRFSLANGTRLWFASSDAMDGRVHCNDKLNFAFQPTFTDLVTQVNQQAQFFNNGSPVNLDAANNGTADVPRFYGGFTRGVGAVALPANAFNQQAAALGLTPTGGSPGNPTINTQLGTTSGNINNPPPNGVYLVNDGTRVTGGIYVEGNVNNMRMVADTTNNRQIYRFEQGGTTSIVTLDYAAGTTSIDRNGTVTTYADLPRGITYVNGRIQDLRGPDRAGGNPVPAILDGNRMLLTTTGDVKLQGDITVDNFDYGTGVFGIFATGGDILIGNSAPSNIHLDAFLMATGSTSVFGVENYNSGGTRGTIHFRGGMVTNYCGATGTMNNRGQLLSGFATDFHFDRRGIVPPYYPMTLRFAADMPQARTLAWKEI